MQNTGKVKKVLIAVGIVLMLFIVSGVLAINSNNVINNQVATRNSSCNVATIPVYGYLTTYKNESQNMASDYDSDVITSSEDVVRDLERADLDPSIKAVLIEIDSSGGSSVAGEEIETTLKSLHKPTVALIRSTGASAAYWAATGADKIFASKDSDVGSIAVTASYLDKVQQDQKEGLNYNQISSGKFKNTGNPDKALTNEERALILRDVNIIHENFVKTVSENRKIPLEKVQALADGSTMLGGAALENNLIDSVGTIVDVKDYLSKRLEIQPELCL